MTLAGLLLGRPALGAAVCVAPRQGGADPLAARGPSSRKGGDAAAGTRDAGGPVAIKWPCTRV